jgi:hypothetical protein
MEAEMFSEGFQNIDLMDSTDIHPRNGFVFRQSKRMHICHHAFFASWTGIVEQRNGHVIRPLFTDVNERPGRKSRLLRSIRHQFHRSVLVRRFESQVKPLEVSRMWTNYFANVAKQKMPKS